MRIATAAGPFPALWRAVAKSSLKAQPRDKRDDEIERLQSNVGEITMDKELLEEKVRRLEARSSPSRGRRSKK
jgi:hypothetical protein